MTGIRLSAEDVKLTSKNAYDEFLSGIKSAETRRIMVGNLKQFLNVACADLLTGTIEERAEQFVDISKKNQDDALGIILGYLEKLKLKCRLDKTDPDYLNPSSVPNKITKKEHLVEGDLSKFNIEYFTNHLDVLERHHQITVIHDTSSESGDYWVIDYSYFHNDPNDTTGYDHALHNVLLESFDILDTDISNFSDENSISIPAWIKNNAGWWAEGQIDDNSFVQGIQFMIKENIISIPNLPESSSEIADSVPAWVKNNAGWWAEGQIDDNSFVQGIEYLVKVGIIKVS